MEFDGSHEEEEVKGQDKSVIAEMDLPIVRCWFEMPNLVPECGYRLGTSQLGEEPSTLGEQGAVS
jgi:hypothetical protein